LQLKLLNLNLKPMPTWSILL